MNFLEYNKDEKLSFNYKKSCGLWLIVVALIIFAATVIGGKQIINMSVFSFGYVAGRVPKSGVSKHFRCLKEVRLFPKI